MSKPYHRNQGKRWTRVRLVELRTLISQNTPLATMALRLGRSKEAVAAKVNALKRRRTVYKHGKDGDVAVVPKNGWYKIACCDCGLVHLFRFATVNARGRVRGQVAFIARRDNRATAALRRHNTYLLRTPNEH